VTIPEPGRRLLVAIHDVGPRFEREVETLRSHLAASVPLANVAMLVVPNHWGEAPLTVGSPFARRLAHWASTGADVFAHGWFHRDTTRHDTRWARLKARHMTAGEGEFLGLGLIDSAQRMALGKRLIEEIIERPVAGFIAPAWLYGPGARQALAEGEFALAEDHWRVWRATTGEIACRGPVITWASRSRARIASSLAVARLLPPLLARTPVVRVAVHPGDTRVPALMDSIARTLDRLSVDRIVSRYADLVPGMPCAS
jgi:predicted deacetylase